jgi:hypothetical protein
VINTLPNLGDQEEKVSISERFKSTAMKLKEKFSPSKIANFVGLDSNKKRENTLERILSFMKKSHERKMQMYGVERLFQEELLNEEQRRHEEFVKVLKKYVSKETEGATLVVSGETDEPGMLKKLTGLIMATVNKTINALVGGIRLIVEGMINSALGALKGLVALLPLLPLVGSISSILSLVGMIKNITKLIGLFGTVLANPYIVTFAALSAAIYYAYKEYSKHGDEIAGRIEYFSNLAIQKPTDQERMAFIDGLPKDIKSGVQVNVIKAFMKPKEARDILRSGNKKEIEIYGENFLFNRSFQDLEMSPEFKEAQKQYDEMMRIYDKEKADQQKTEDDKRKPQPYVPSPPAKRIENLPEVPGQAPPGPPGQKQPSPPTAVPVTNKGKQSTTTPTTPTTVEPLTPTKIPDSTIGPGVDLITGGESSKTTPLTRENITDKIAPAPSPDPVKRMFSTPTINNTINNNSTESVAPTSANVRDVTSILDFVFNNSRAYV